MNIVDMHCDTIYLLHRSCSNPSLRKNNLQIDLNKMKQGGYLLQNFALYVNMEESANPLETALMMADLFYCEMEKNKDLIRPVTTYEQIVSNQKKGLMSALLTLEEGEICLGSLSHLRNFYRLGVRMMTLTWNFENQLAYPNYFPKKEDYDQNLNPKHSNVWPIGGSPCNLGLKEKGFSFLAEMERLGIIIDVSHLSDGGFYDVLNHTSKPFVASHSNARSLCQNCRNLTDDMIRSMGERGCLIGLNYFGNFLTFHPDGSPSESTITDIARHARHIANTGGIECLGLGSDFDGFTGKAQLYDCSCLPLLETALKKQDFTSSEIDQIFYKNVLNLYRELL